MAPKTIIILHTTFYSQTMA